MPLKYLSPKFVCVWHLLAGGACIVFGTTLQLTKLHFKVIEANIFLW